MEDCVTHHRATTLRLPFFYPLLVLAMLAAACFRLPSLSLRPMHADEANQAVKTGILWETGRYHYDVADHHGPSLYWLTLPSLWASGAGDFVHSQETAYLLVALVFGIALIGLLALFADGLGRGPIVLAAVLTAISPAMVYYSRYYIQEMLLVFFTTATLGAGWRYCRTGRTRWAAAAGAAIGFMHATKETWILAAAAAGAALVLTLLWTRWRDGLWLPWHDRVNVVPVVAALGAAVIVAGAFYSSFGTEWSGPWKSIAAYASYWHRGSEGAGHAEPWYYYLRTFFAFRPARGFFWSEGLLPALALVAWALVELPNRKRPQDDSRLALRESGAEVPSLPLVRFLAFYTLVLVVLYAIIRYKTPWCFLTPLSSLIVLGGAGGWWAVARVPGRVLKAVVAILLLAGAVHLAWQAKWLCFHLPADVRNPYVYAHTPPGILDVARRLDRLADRTPQGHDLVIHVIVPENYWPLPWYLRHFTASHVGYWFDAESWRTATRQGPAPAVLFVATDVAREVDAGLQGDYNRQMLCSLRPGVFVSVYVRTDIWPKLISAE